MDLPVELLANQACVALCASLQLLRQADTTSQRPFNILCYKQLSTSSLDALCHPRNKRFHKESYTRATYKGNRQWLTIHMEVRTPAAASRLANCEKCQLLDVLTCGYDTNNLFSSASIRASSDLCSLSRCCGCAGHGPSGSRYAQLIASHALQPAYPSSSRPSTRHVLSPRIGTASRCSAVQYWRAS